MSPTDSLDPAMANPPRPGLNGWVLVRKQRTSDALTVTIDGLGDGTRFPSGPGYGLYVVEPADHATVDSAGITFYWPTELGILHWTRLSGSSGWSIPALNPDAARKTGLTPYTTTYDDGQGWSHHLADTSTPAFAMANGIPVFSARTSAIQHYTQGLRVGVHRTVTVNGIVCAFERSTTL